MFILPAVHPFARAVFIEWCEDAGFPPELMLARLEKRVPTPRGLAQRLLELYGVPLDAWWLEDEAWWGGETAYVARDAKRARGLPKKRPVPYAEAATMPAKMQAETVSRGAAIAHGMRQARGKNTAHPFVRWLDSEGLSLRDWARRHKIPRSNVQAWLADGKARRECPQSWRAVIASESGGTVPASTWDD